MPTLPATKLTTLKDAPLGSLLSFQHGGNDVRFGIRVGIARRDDALDSPGTPGVAVLTRRADGGFETALVAAGYSPQDGTGIPENTPVVDHGSTWSLQVLPKDWEAKPSHRTFAIDDNGLLLLANGGELGMAVGERHDCYLLNLNTLSAAPPPGGRSYIAARRWDLFIPGPAETDRPFDFAPGAGTT